jgi:hypothetical protein
MTTLKSRIEALERRTKQSSEPLEIIIRNGLPPPVFANDDGRVHWRMEGRDLIITSPGTARK